jgi:hypothetical protein
MLASMRAGTPRTEPRWRARPPRNDTAVPHERRSGLQHALALRAVVVACGRSPHAADPPFRYPHRRRERPPVPPRRGATRCPRQRGAWQTRRLRHEDCIVGSASPKFPARRMALACREGHIPEEAPHSGVHRRACQRSAGSERLSFHPRSTDHDEGTDEHDTTITSSRGISSRRSLAGGARPRTVARAL